MTSQNTFQQGTLTTGLGIMIGRYPESIQENKTHKLLWRFEETCCHSDSNEKLSATAGVKNSQKRKIIGQNTEKSPRDLWRLAVTQTPMKNYQLPLV